MQQHAVHSHFIQTLAAFSHFKLIDFVLKPTHLKLSVTLMKYFGARTVSSIFNK